MRQSELFTKTLREAPAEEVSMNAQLLTRGGFVHKVMAGAYAYLPLGLRVLNKIQNIIREEMDKIGGQELLLTALQPPEIWEKSGRWNDEVVDVWFKTKLKNGSELGLGNTHEEALTDIATHFISSHKDLPFSTYQFQTKFRNELRAKSGLMRTREFIMKDLYSFSRTQQEHDVFYEQAKQAYLKIFGRLGLGDTTILTFASGGSFSKYSHEFQTICDSGEDTVYLDKAKRIAVNKEVFTDDVLSDLSLRREDLEEVKAIEVGNIFSLGTKFSDAFGLRYTDESGASLPVIMGSYGIGPGRAMGTVVELFHDEKGIVWPAAIAPFQVHLIALEGGYEQAEKLYSDLADARIETLFDDRQDKTPGEKFADADLIGIPVRVVVSTRTLEKNSVEIKKRSSKEADIVSLGEIINRIKN